MGASIFNKRQININYPVSIAPLVTFRIVFGLLMCFSLIRFWCRGWITNVYVTPKFHFTYTGFEWVKPFSSTGMHVLFFIVILAALCITLGLFYRAAALLFFLGFTYIELIDLTTYLNHYYFISLVAFLMIFLPANRSYSLDVRLRGVEGKQFIPAWCIGIIRFQMAILYVFAGIAKLNADWLLEAQPMRLWLPAKSHLPVVGSFMYSTWVAYLFSWFGAAYDLFIVFFLLNKKTRPVAYGFVLLFHLATAIFFPGIGMFPYVMMVSGLIFFSGIFHEKLLLKLPFYKKNCVGNNNLATYGFRHTRTISFAIALYALIQIIVPVRFLLYPDHLFWTEEGYRFSWRVMLMEKTGAAYFTVKDLVNNQYTTVNNAAFLTPVQEKMMSTQPDMILKYAHFLAKEYQQRGFEQPAVYGEIYVSLNGRHSTLFIDSTVNLAIQPTSWKHYHWVLPYKK